MREPGTDVLVLGCREDNVAISIVFDLGQSPFLNGVLVFANGLWRVLLTCPCNKIGLILSTLNYQKPRSGCGEEGGFICAGHQKVRLGDESLHFRRVVGQPISGKELFLVDLSDSALASIQRPGRKG